MTNKKNTCITLSWLLLLCLFFLQVTTMITAQNTYHREHIPFSSSLADSSFTTSTKGTSAASQRTVESTVSATKNKKPAWKRKTTTLQEGKNFSFKVSKSKKSQYVRFFSSVKKVASIHIKKGKLMAKKEGTTIVTANVYARSGKIVKTLKCRLTVTKASLKKPAATSDKTNTSSTKDKNFTPKPDTGQNSSIDMGLNGSITLPITADTNNTSDYTSTDTSSGGNSSSGDSSSSGSSSSSGGSSSSSGNSSSSGGSSSSSGGNSSDLPSDGTEKPVVLQAGELNNWNYTLALSLSKAFIENDLKDTSLLLHKNGTNPLTLMAYFNDLSPNGRVAYYKLNKESQQKLQPGNSSMDGNYTVSSEDLIFSSDFDITYEELIQASTIQGFVYNAAAKAIPWAKVSVYSSDTKDAKSLLLTTRTNEQGYYSFICKKQNVCIVVEKEGYNSLEKNSVTPDTLHAKSCNFKMQRWYNSELSYKFCLFDTEDKPVANAKVCLYNEEKTSVWEARSDESGCVLFCNSDALPKIQKNDNHIIRSNPNHEIFTNQQPFFVKINKDFSNENHKEIIPATYSFVPDANNSCSVTKKLTLHYAPKLTSIPVQLTWTSDAVEKMNGMDLCIYADLLSDDGETCLLSPATSYDATVSARNYSISFDYVTAYPSLFSKDIHLKDGTYYLRIYDKQINNTSVRFHSTIIIPVTLEDGVAAPSKGTIDLACNLQVYNSANPDAIGDISVATETNYSVKIKCYQILDDNKKILLTKATSNSLLRTYPYSISTPLWMGMPGNKYLIVTSLMHAKETQFELLATESYSNPIRISHAVSGSSISSVKIYPQNNDALSAETAPVKVNSMSLRNKAGKVVCQYDDADKEMFHLEESLYAYRKEDGCYHITIPEELWAFYSLEPDWYDLVLTLQNYAPVTSDMVNCKAMHDHTLSVEKSLQKNISTSLSGTILCEGQSLTSSKEFAASIMLYDMQGNIVAGKNLPSGSSSYTLTNAVDGVLHTGEYQLVIRGDGIHNYHSYISIIENKINKFNISCQSCTPGKVNLRLLGSGQHAISFGKSQSRICLMEKGYPANSPQNWLIPSYYQDLYYTETIPLIKSDTVTNEWQSGNCIPSGLYLLDIWADFCSPYTKTISLADKQVLQKEITLPRQSDATTVDYTIHLKNVKEPLKELVAVCYLDDGSIVDQNILINSDSSKNGITLTLFAKKAQKIIVYHDGQPLTYYDITPSNYSDSITIDCGSN